MENREPLKLLSQRQYPLRTFSDINLPEKSSLFQYNTTIVDLNPFESKKEDNTSIHGKNQQASFISDTRFRSENNVIFNKIVNQKKFLINKSIRFYEPVKDAKERNKIMSDFDTLRSKLASSQTRNYTPPQQQKSPRDLDAFDKDEYYPVKNQDLVETFKNLNSHSSNSSEKLNGNERHEDKITLKSLTMSSFEDKFIPIKVFRTKKRVDKEVTRERSSSKGVLSSAKGGANVIKQPPLSENASRTTHYTDLTEKDKHPTQHLEKANSSNRYEDFSELKRFSRYHTNLTRKSLEKRSSNPRRAQKYQVANESNPADTYHAENTFNKLEAPFSSTDNARSLLSQSNASSKRLNIVVRKSSKHRLENIYKPEKSDSAKTQIITTKKSNENLVIPAANPLLPTNSGVSLNSHVNNLVFQKSMHFVDGNDSTVLCNDPNCEYKSLTKSVSLQNVQNKNKKEFPHERYQRIKKAEVQTIENIIGDIPSTLHVSI